MTAFGLVAVIILILANGYFVAAEFSFVAARRGKLEEAADGGDKKSAKALLVLKRLSFMLSGAQLGITVTSLVVGFIAEPVFVAVLEPVFEAAGVGEDTRRGLAIATGFVLATMAQMVFGELAPKNLAIARPEPVARAVAGSTAVFLTVAGPVIRLFDGAANALLRRLGIEPVEELHAGVSAEEFDYIVGESAEQGSLTHHQADLLQRSVDFRTITADDAKTPRARVAVAGADDTCEGLRALLTSPHSRFPVVAASDDPSEDGRIVGVVHAKNLLDVPATSWSTTPVSALMSEPVAVPSTASLPAVLTALRRSATTLAIVVDEHGSETGIITLEDLLEELVGEIEDEYDAARPGGIEAIDERTWLIPGSWRLDEIERETGVVLPEGDYDTVAGLVVTQLSRLAEVGDHVHIEGTLIDVREVDRWAVTKVCLQIPMPEAEADDEDAP